MKAKKWHWPRISSFAVDRFTKNRPLELCGADPYQFAELREPGLINEQINWKQRFFVPSDETSGVDILTSLLGRYPVIATEEAPSETESDATEIVPAPAIATTNIIDIDEWILTPVLDSDPHELNTAADQTSSTTQESQRSFLLPSKSPPFLGARLHSGPTRSWLLTSSEAVNK